ncbi:MAG: hypothetical protein ACYC35_27250 [Pirellulales bacterium]
MLENHEKTSTFEQGAALRAAVGAGCDTLPAELSQIIDAWPTLPEPIKAGIMAMVTAATIPTAAQRAEGGGGSKICAI